MDAKKILIECQAAAEKAASSKYDELVKAGPRYAVYSADLMGNKIPGSSVGTMLDNCGGAYLVIPGTGEFISGLKKAALNVEGTGVNRRYDGMYWHAFKNVYKGYCLSIKYSLNIQQEVSVHRAAMDAALKILKDNGVTGAYVHEYID
jgi:hypothetical protein